MRAVQVLVAAIILGLAGGYGWSAMPPRKVRVEVPKPVIAVPPDTPQSLSDREWAARGTDQEAPAVAPAGPDPTAVEQSAYYATCRDAWAAGKAPLHAGEPGYRSGLDVDGDGVACERVAEPA